MNRNFFVVPLLAGMLILLGAGCTKSAFPALPPLLSNPQNGSDMSVTSTAIGWSNRGEGIDRAAMRFSTSTASDIILYRFSLRTYEFAFRHATSVTLSEWIKQESDAVFAVNGVYFHEDELPSGWLKVNEKVIGSRVFDVEKSALLVLHPVPGIYTSGVRVKQQKLQSRDAAQSFPLLIAQGRAAVKEDSGKLARRTFVGIDQAHEYFYVGLVPYTGISLYELSQALARIPIRWEAVLNMDGGPSSGLAFRGMKQSELIDSYVTVPNVMVVLPKTTK